MRSVSCSLQEVRKEGWKWWGGREEDGKAHAWCLSFVCAPGRKGASQASVFGRQGNSLFSLYSDREIVTRMVALKTCCLKIGGSEQDCPVGVCGAGSLFPGVREGPTPGLEGQMGYDSLHTLG